MTLTGTALAAIMPKANSATWLGPLNTSMASFDITSASRMAAFLATIAHESDECRRLAENLKYSAKRITEVWPKRFPTVISAQPFAQNPELLANAVYSNRLGNGNVASGDGFRFRGRGLIQLTGRSNYRQVGLAIGLSLEDEPESLQRPSAAALAAAYFWQSRGCNALADSVDDDDDDADFVRITKIVNGGTVGMASRREYWRRAKLVLAT